MAKGTINNISIKGIACAVPDQVRDAEFWYDKFGYDAVDKFTKMTGVKRVCYSIKRQTASDLAYIAAENLLKEKKIDPKSIGAIIFVTQGADYRKPATSFVLQHRLGISENSISFDVNLGCSGYVKGINIISSIMKSSDVRRGLLLVGDISTEGISPDDKSSVMLFGDAGSATLLEKDKNSSNKINYHMKSNGNGFKAIITPAGGYRNLNSSYERILWPVDNNIRSDYDLYMNGMEVFTFTISEVPKLIKEFLLDTKTNIEDYDCYSMHQANLFILQQIGKKTKIPMEKMLISMDRFGNTSVASIPLTLSDRYGEKNEGETNAFMCGFGVGLSWGIVTATIKNSDILPIIYSNDYYKDGGAFYD